MHTGRYREDHSSQLPAMLLLANLGWTYLSPAEADRLRRGNLGQVILTPVLEQWLRANNRIEYRGAVHTFSEANIREAIEQLRRIDWAEGVHQANEAAFDLLMLGCSPEQRIDGDRKSYNLRYIDWERPERNFYHFTAEFSVLREGRADTYRPDIVLFVNGIPLAVMENKRPDLQSKGDKPVDQAVSQHARNQDVDEGVPRLYLYSQLLVAADGREALYATAGTEKKFWAVWKEKYDDGRAAEADQRQLHELVNRRDPAVWDAVFTDDFAYARSFFEALYRQPVSITEQDRLLYHLLRPERLLEISYRYILFDHGVKKVARYQQYFAVQRTLKRVRELRDGRRRGGVIWHTQGSGKSLTMVMLAKGIALEPAIPDPRVIVVTDRIDLDKQITKTIRNCGKEDEVAQARSGRHLLELLRQGKPEIITTILHKFERVQEVDYQATSPNIFVLIDESHRSQYGEAAVRMEQVLPRACFIGFTGTPLMKKEKNTAEKYGGYIDKYTIDEAVRDKAVVPLLYEGREIPLTVNKEPLDRYFDLITRQMTDKQKADLKKRFSRAGELQQADQRLQMIAIDVTTHFVENWRGTGFKGQLTAPSKLAAVRLHQYFRQMNELSTAVVISSPDTRESTDNPNESTHDEVQRFWADMMKQYGNADRYQEQLIDRFSKTEEPELLIVVDKLLTGFDAPRNTVLYLTRPLREHTLLQAIARVNRLADGKDYGYIIDYEGILGDLDQALTTYSSLEGFDEKDLEGALTANLEELKQLPQLHSELWDIFRGVRNQLDNEAMEQQLADEDLRQEFYRLQGQFSRLLKLGLSTLDWLNATDPARVNQYRRDLKYFAELRTAVQQRYSDVVNYGHYEAQIKQLIDRHVAAEAVEVRVQLVDISNKEAFAEEVERAVGPRAKADLIASRTAKYLTENMDKDPAYFRKLSEILQDIIDELRQRWDSLSEEGKRFLLQRLRDVGDQALHPRENEPLDTLIDEPLARSLFHLLQEGAATNQEAREDGRISLLCDLSNHLYQAVMQNKRVDWKRRDDVQLAMRRAMDEVLYDYRDRYGMPSLDELVFLDQAMELARRNLD